MAKHLRIKPSDKMSDAINNNAQILMSMVVTAYSLGFGEKCMDVCDSQNVDCNTFLAVVNFISRKDYKSYPISLDSLMSYLKNAHKFLLNFHSHYR